MEAASRCLLEATSWMDWWMCTAKPMALHDMSDPAKVKQLFVAGTCFQFLVVKTASTIWANTFLRSRDAVLGRSKTAIASNHL